MPNRFPPKLVITVTVFVFLIAGIYLWQKIGLPAARGGWVGVATADGATYFGELVLADKKSVILRNVYTSAGYYAPPVEEGKPPEKPKLQVSKYGATAVPGMEESEDTLTLPRSRVLFISKDVSPQVFEAIRTWTPPTPPPPPPTPEAIPEEAATPSPAVEVPTPTPTPMPRTTPRATPVTTPKP